MKRANGVRSERARVLKAMAHPSRLLILETLAGGERCVCDLQRRVGSDLSTVSKHLALMRLAGLVVDRREGLQVFYSLRVPCIMSFFDCIDAVRAGRRPVSARRSQVGDAVPANACCAEAPEPRSRSRHVARAGA
jgi:ArsR family transcriptional regulator